MSLCPHHSGLGKLLAREPYDPIMRDLSRSQSGKGLARKACAICAYERGRLDMRKQIVNWLADNWRDVPLDEVPGGDSSETSGSR